MTRAQVQVGTTPGLQEGAMRSPSELPPIPTPQVNYLVPAPQLDANLETMKSSDNDTQRLLRIQVQSHGLPNEIETPGNTVEERDQGTRKEPHT